jgi:hypothetical protein
MSYPSSLTHYTAKPDFNGDGNTDLLWAGPNGDYFTCT